MKILFCVNIRIPGEKASSIQTAFTCQALSNFADVTLAVPELKTKKSFDQIYSFKPKFRTVYLNSVEKYVFPLLNFISFHIKRKTYTKSLVKYVLENNDFDVIYFRDFFSLYTLIKLKKEGKINSKIVFECHDLVHLSSTGIISKIFDKKKELFAIKNSDCVTAITQPLKEKILELAENQTVSVVPDGVDLNLFDLPLSKIQARKKLGLPEKYKIVAYSGQFYAWKGFHLLLEAAKKFNENTKLLVLGGKDDEVEDLQQRFTDVWFYGTIPHEKVGCYLKAADVLVLPNTRNLKSELFTSPLKLFEYMASKNPIVCSDLPSLRSVLTENEAVFFEPGNAEDLFNKIEFALNNPEKSDVLAENAYKKAKKFTWENRAKKIVDCISDLFEKENN